MAHDVHPERHQDPAEIPEVEAAREQRDERGSAAQLEEAVKRIQEAVAGHRVPEDADIALAQRYLGNGELEALLAGREVEDPKHADQGMVAQAAPTYRIAIYVRKKFTRGPLDPGQAIVTLEGEEGVQLYGFHPLAAGADAFRRGGVSAEVSIDPAQVVDGVRTAEMTVTREQLDVARLHAETLRLSPPKFDLWRWTSVDFAGEICTAADIDEELPSALYEEIADARAMSDQLTRLGVAVVENADGDDDDKGEEEPPAEALSEGQAEEQAEAAEEKDDKKPGFFRSLFGGGKGKA